MSSMTSEEDLVDPLTDGDAEHLAFTQRIAEPYLSHIRNGLFLLRWMLDKAPRPTEDTFINDLAAAACFTRVYRQIRAATLMVVFGYYSEVPTVLRGAYEAGALGRYLAKEPQKAEKWLKKGSWIPDREVRKWFGDGDRMYAAWYKFYSERAHPTAKSCIPLLDLAEDGSTYSISFTTQKNEESLKDCLLEIAWTSMWACFALQRAASRVDVLPPAWRREVDDFAIRLGALFEEHTGQPVDFSHLERDWAKEERRWNAFIEQLPDAAETDRALSEHPMSVHNIHPQDDL